MSPMLILSGLEKFPDVQTTRTVFSLAASIWCYGKQFHNRCCNGVSAQLFLLRAEEICFESSRTLWHSCCAP